MGCTEKKHILLGRWPSVNNTQIFFRNLSNVTNSTSVSGDTRQQQQQLHTICTIPSSTAASVSSYIDSINPTGHLSDTEPAGVAPVSPLEDGHLEPCRWMVVGLALV